MDEREWEERGHPLDWMEYNECDHDAFWDWTVAYTDQIIDECGAMGLTDQQTGDVLRIYAYEQAVLLEQNPGLPLRP